MKKIENKYFAWGLTALAVVASAILIYFLFLRINSVFEIISKIFIILRPLIYGLVIAFLLIQSYNFFERRIQKLLKKKINDINKVRKISKITSIIISVLILLIILFLVLYILIPKLIVNIIALINMITNNMDNIEEWLKNALKSNSVIENIVLSTVNKSSNSILDWISTGVLPTFENIVASFSNGLSGMYIFLKDFLVGIVFSIYIVIDKKTFVNQTKKLMYALLGIKTTNSILEGTRYSYVILNGFLKGKIITSVGIGVACYLLMIILGMPYASLISLIVAITNIIPFFGPFIGWIPGVIILLISNPMQALYFSIIIVILQQIEGNIIAPKIVSNKTGISSFWVLFSILVFGDLFGFIGMIIGVPIFAVIYHFIAFYLRKKLKNKDLPTNTNDYDNIKYIDEKTKEIIKEKSSN